LPSAAGRNDIAQIELERALRATGAVRHQHLIRLSDRYPHHPDTWVALAEDHLGARRREEALHAVERALRLDPRAHQRFSPALLNISRHLVSTAQSDQTDSPAPSNAPSRAAGSGRREARIAARSSARRVARGSSTASPARSTPRGSGPQAASYDPGRAASDLERAMHLQGPARRARLETLGDTYPQFGPIHLALAEEHIADRRVEEALGCLDRALSLDPSLEGAMSRKLYNAHRFHGSPAAADNRGVASADRRPKARARSFGVERTPAPIRHTSSAPRPRPTTGSFGRELAGALERPERGERIQALRALLDVEPDHSAVLFHYAIETALAGHRDEAKRAGDRLKHVSPERYHKLYALAESYWPARRGGPAPAPSSSVQPTVMMSPALPPVVQAPHGHHRPDHAQPHPAIHPQAQPKKTMLLPVPVEARVPQPVNVQVPRSSAAYPQLQPYPTASVRTTRSKVATALAVTAGVLAGVLIAVLLVVALGGSKKSESKPEGPREVIDVPMKPKAAKPDRGPSAQLTPDAPRAARVA
jgi:tetratricopeptide (TPR) repeat protein